MFKNQREVKGITLVALVITIILLLILAGISIATLTGSGLFEKARLAEQESKNAQEKEEDTLKDYEDKIGEYINSNRDIVTISKEEYEYLKNNVNLSTEEKVIGTWIDGKKLYSKTVVIDATTAESQQYNHNIENVDTIYIDEGNTFLVHSNGNVTNSMNVGVSSGKIAEGYLVYIQAINKTYITIRCGVNSATAKAYVTLKYTKTTD